MFDQPEGKACGLILFVREVHHVYVHLHHSIYSYVSAPRSRTWVYAVSGRGTLNYPNFSIISNTAVCRCSVTAVCVYAAFSAARYAHAYNKLNHVSSATFQLYILLDHWYATVHIHQCTTVCRIMLFSSRVPGRVASSDHDQKVNAVRLPPLTECSSS